MYAHSYNGKDFSSFSSYFVHAFTGEIKVLLLMKCTHHSLKPFLIVKCILKLIQHKKERKIPIVPMPISILKTEEGKRVVTIAPPLPSSLPLLPPTLTS